MAHVKINKNERSWAIEMISQINTIASNNDLLIKRAGGESTVSVDLKMRMFPDVILYGDKGLNSILQGWELKMPDVPITDAAFVNDAQRKARFLHLGSCVIWNFQYVKFYVYNAIEDTFEVAKQWNNPQIQTRKDVEDKVLISKYVNSKLLDGKSDLSYYIVLQLASLLKNSGYLGVIVSNSWLGTKAGEKFYQSLTDIYDLKQVHISGKGRWFDNADVVTTILILQKKASMAETENKTSFFVWKKNLDAIASDHAVEQQIVNSALTNKVSDYTVMAQSVYTESQIDNLKMLGLSYNALFHDVSWLLDIKDKLVPLKSLFTVIRGSRRGWDKLFFPKDNVDIEEKFLKPALFNAKKTTTLLGQPDKRAFCCSESLEVLREYYPKAYKWIMQFATLTNKKGKPLTEILKTSTTEWYEMKPNEVVQFFTMMNPDKRFFFGRFKEPTFINQRLIGLQAKMPMDEELYHALLNSVLMKFYVEAVGFGRGLGVLDMNKDSIEKCHILNPSLLSDDSIAVIKEKFRVVFAKNIVSIEEELQDKDWIDFNQTVLKSFGLDGYYLRMSNSLLSMRKVRKAATEKKKITILKDINKHNLNKRKINDSSVAMVAEK